MLKFFSSKKETNLSSVRRMYADSVIVFATRPEDYAKFNPVGELVLIMKEPTEQERRKIDETINDYVLRGYEVRTVMGSNMAEKDIEEK